MSNMEKEGKMGKEYSKRNRTPGSETGTLRFTGGNDNRMIWTPLLNKIAIALNEGKTPCKERERHHRLIDRHSPQKKP